MPESPVTWTVCTPKIGSRENGLKVMHFMLHLFARDWEDMQSFWTGFRKNHPESQIRPTKGWRQGTEHCQGRRHSSPNTEQTFLKHLRTKASLSHQLDSLYNCWFPNTCPQALKTHLYPGAVQDLRLQQTQLWWYLPICKNKFRYTSYENLISTWKYICQAAFELKHNQQRSALKIWT